MSRGPGRVERGVLATLERFHHPLGYAELAKAIFAAAAPTASQRDSVGRACRALQRDGLVNIAYVKRDDREITGWWAMIGGEPVIEEERPPPDSPYHWRPLTRDDATIGPGGRGQTVVSLAAQSQAAARGTTRPQWRGHRWRPPRGLTRGAR